jgi:amino acid adenylation domain-containing protein
MVNLLHDQLTRAAQAAPQTPAVIDRSRSVNYGDLETQANQLAHALVSRGIKPGDRVGILLDKSVEAVISVYGIMKAGAVYVPLDVLAPAARLAFMVQNSDMTCLVTSGRRLRDVRQLITEGAPLTTVVRLGDEEAESQSLLPQISMVEAAEVDVQDHAAPAVRRISQDLAYILYTSGSTGKPKGVMLTHRNGLAFVDWAVVNIGVTREDRLSSHAPLHFDLSIFDLFAASSAGAAVVLVPPETSRFPMQVKSFMLDSAISIWYSVPSILTMLTLRGGLSPGDLPRLEKVLFAGEVFPTKYLRQLMHQLQGVEFWNLYGPTETNVCTAYRVPQSLGDQTAPVPIGKAVSDDETFVLTEGGGLAAPGEPGILHVRGASVMAGYWNDAVRTDGVLRRSLHHRPLEDRAYCTGDLVREGPDGNYEFIGRIDSQVKTRGYRVELGEIEVALQAHENVVEAGVVAAPDEVVGSRLIAFVSLQRPTDIADLREHCSRTLPAYMLPERVHVVDDLPKTSTGKLDRQMLAGMSMTTNDQASEEPDDRYQR